MTTEEDTVHYHYLVSSSSSLSSFYSVLTSSLSSLTTSASVYVIGLEDDDPLLGFNKNRQYYKSESEDQTKDEWIRSKMTNLEQESKPMKAEIDGDNATPLAKRKSWRTRILKRLRSAFHWRSKRAKQSTLDEKKPKTPTANLYPVVLDELDAVCNEEDNDLDKVSSSHVEDVPEIRAPLTPFEEMCQVLQEKLFRFGRFSEDPRKSLQTTKQQNNNLSVVSFQLEEGSVRRMAEKFSKSL